MNVGEVSALGLAVLVLASPGTGDPAPEDDGRGTSEERPRPLELSVQHLANLTGEYEFSPAIMARVFLVGERLFGFMTGQQREVELLARSEVEFFLREDPDVAIRFTLDASGRAYEILVTLDGEELVGRWVSEVKEASSGESSEPDGLDSGPEAVALEGTELGFTLPDLEGNLVSRADARFEGKVLLVDLWGTWCPPCREMTPYLNRLHSRYAADGLEIVGIAFEYRRDDGEDPRVPVARYVVENDIEHVVLYGGSAERPSSLVFSRLLLPEFDGFPTTIVLARDGTVRAVVEGFDDAIALRLESLARELLAEDS